MKNYRHKFKIYKDGFTLAEVLITLVIIGVIAAITIPNVIAYYKKEETASKLKKFYSTLNQVISRSVVDNGHYSTWDLSGSDNSHRTAFFLNKYIFPYMQVVKTCTPTSNECWPNYIYAPLHNQGYECSAILSDGSRIFVWVGQDSSHAWFLVDINGERNPNKLGSDVFMFLIRFFAVNSNDQVGLFPAGLGYQELPSRETLKQQCSNFPEKCSSLIVIDGWQIKDDYPYRL